MKRKISIALNFLIIIFEIIGFIITIKNNGKIAIEYYTEDSNIISLFASIIFSIYIVKNKKIPFFIKLLKYISVLCLTITFLVVIFILIPMYDFDFSFLLFKNEMLFHHVLCPLLSIISFLFFDELGGYSEKESIYASLVTLWYGIIMLILNVLDVISGPYPFLEFKNQKLIVSIIWSVILLSLTYIVSILLNLIKMRTCYKDEQV